jgi:SpoVK/Ycf46/Vps4 family AAA+-type ATPase
MRASMPSKIPLPKSWIEILSCVLSRKCVRPYVNTLQMRAPLTHDLIRGKGKGVVILLHGLPEVGKTATAEAVAQKWNKPLFPITCGDLGDTAASVEKTLNEIFRFAHLW